MWLWLQVDVVSSGTVEFLVRFATGSGGRKVPVHRWLVLEEHCAAVGVAVVWGMPSLEGKGEVVVWPTHVLARTRLECASSAGANMDMLKLDGRKTKAGVKALSHFFGEDSACELPLNDCATSFFSPKFEAMRKTDNKILCVSMAMAQIELEEQRRVKAWRESQDENKRGYGGVVTEGTEANIRRALLKDVKEEREARYSGRDTVGKVSPSPLAPARSSLATFSSHCIPPSCSHMNRSGQEPAQGRRQARRRPTSSLGAPFPVPSPPANAHNNAKSQRAIVGDCPSQQEVTPVQRNCEDASD